MGTNYYLEENGESLHIGKSSAGWEFSFRGYDEDIRSWKDWQNKIAGRDVIDEYGGKMSFTDFKRMVESSEGQNHTAYCKKKYEDIYLDLWQDDEGYSFYGGEFS